MTRPAYFVMARGWMDHPDLATKEPFTRREAWAWLVENVAFSNTTQRVGAHLVEVRRGQLSTSFRMLAKEWNRPVAWVQRFLERLETSTAIGTATDTGRLLITLCNYDKYQLGGPDSDTRTDTERSTLAIQERYTGDTQKKEGKESKREGLRPSPADDLFGGSLEGAEPAKAGGPKRSAARNAPSPPEPGTGAVQPAKAPGKVPASFKRTFWPKRATPEPVKVNPAWQVNGWHIAGVMDHALDIVEVGENYWPGFAQMIFGALEQGADPDEHIYPVMHEAKKFGYQKIQSVGFFMKLINERLRTSKLRMAS